MYKCKICGSKFDSYLKLGGHAANCGVEYIQCSMCPKMIKKQYLSWHVKHHNGVENRCKFCGKTITLGNKFCNHSCSASYNNLGNNKYAKRVVYNKCKNCGGDTKNVYCSMKCRDEYRKVKYIEQWLNGTIDVTTKANRPSLIVRNYLMSIRGEKCEICGWSEMNPHTGIVPVNLHHIDGNWKNNSIDNLQILCPNCHSLTKSYGGSNKGNGRDSRQEWRKKMRSGPDGKGSALQADNKQGVRLS